MLRYRDVLTVISRSKPHSSNDYPRDSVGFVAVNSTGGRCTGATFSSQLVLTAAHCFADGNGNFVWPVGFSAGMDGTAIFGTQTIAHDRKPSGRTTSLAGRHPGESVACFTTRYFGVNLTTAVSPAVMYWGLYSIQ